MSDNLVEIRELTKIFHPQKPKALDSLSLTFRPHQITGIVGPDGAGKTTLLRLIAGLLTPSSGRLQVLGFDTINETREIAKRISYMPQRFGLYEDLTVEENLLLYARLRGLSMEKREETFATLLEFTGLKNFQKRLAGNLSGGMKQKLGLACALLKKPDLLLLDEPTVGVDPISRRQLWKMIEELAVEGISILWSTAYLDDAAKSKEVLLLNQGKALYFGPPEELTTRVKGRTYHLIGKELNRREVLSRAILDPRIVDAVIQGDAVRMVIAENQNPPTPSDLGAPTDAKVIPIPPRFEDAFIEVLGGCPKESSKLAGLLNIPEERREVVIEVEDLTKQFGSFTAVDHISFKVNRGEVFGLLGPNGAGKSTTFKMLTGLLTPTSGKCFVARISMQKAKSEARQRMGYMAQKFSLYGNLTLLQNLNFFSGIYSVPKERRKKIIGDMVDIFEFSPLIDQEAGELPLGFKQRLALAACTMHGPDILFLDEPTSGVDPVTRREFWNHINGLVAKGVTILITTHFMDEAEYCDRIALINQGKIIMIDTPEALKRSAVSPEMPSPTLEDAFIALSEKAGGINE